MLKFLYRFVSMQAITRGLYAAGIIVVLGISGYVLILRKHIGEERQARTQAELAASNAEARASITRELGGKALAGAIDSTTHVYERKLVQVRQDADKLDRALKQERVARVGAAVNIVRLEAMLEALSTVRGDTLTATFDEYQKPYRIHAEATLLPPPGTSKLLTDITLDPLSLEVRLGCLAPVAGRRVRPASVSVTVPTWASVVLGQVEQSPEVCQPDLNSDGATKSGGRWATVGKVAAGSAALLTVLRISGVVR